MNQRSTPFALLLVVAQFCGACDSGGRAGPATPGLASRPTAAASGASLPGATDESASRQPLARTVIAAAADGFCAIAGVQRSVWCWGKWLTRDRTRVCLSFTEQRQSADAVELAGGAEGYICARREDGSVACWFPAERGAAQELVPTGGSVGISGWVDTCSIDTRGAVRCWSPDFARYDVGTAEPVRRLAMGEGTCGVSATGAVMCWADDGCGARAGVESGALTPSLPSADQAGRVAGTSCALCGESLWCWGSCGDDHEGPVRWTVPHHLMSAGARGLMISWSAFCAIDGDRGLMCPLWGGPGYPVRLLGAADDVPLTRIPGPISAFSVGFNGAILERPDGSIWWWGNDGCGTDIEPPGVRLPPLGSQ